MKSFRTTAIFAVLAVSFLTYVYLFEFKKPQEEETRQEQAKKILNLPDSQIDKIELSSQNIKIKAEKKDGKWQLLEPKKDLGDTGAISGWIQELTARSSDSVVEKIPTQDNAKKELYGLKEPAGVLQFSTADGKIQIIQIGSKTGFAGRSYLRLISSQEEKDFDVLLADGAWTSDLSKGTKFFRDKKIIRAEFKDLHKINWSVKGEKTVELVKKDKTWQLVSPIQEMADDLEVQGLLRSLQELATTEFIEQTSKNKINAKDMAANLKLSFANEKLNEEISFSRAKSNVVTVGLHSHKEELFQIFNDTFQALPKKLAEFRDKHKPFHFDPTKAKKIQWHLASEKYHLEIKNSAWLLVSAEPSSVDMKTNKADSSAVIQMLSHLSTSKLFSYLDEKNRKNFNPQRSVQIFDEKNKIFSADWMTSPISSADIWLQTSLSKDLIIVRQNDWKEVDVELITKATGKP